MQNLWHQPSHRSYVRGDERSWLAPMGLGFAVGVAYLLTAHLSLSLLTKPDSVAVFWPALWPVGKILDRKRSLRHQPTPNGHSGDAWLP